MNDRPARGYLAVNLYRGVHGWMLAAMVRRPGGKFPRLLWRVYDVPLGVPEDASVDEVAEALKDLITDACILANDRRRRSRSGAP